MNNKLQEALSIINDTGFISIKDLTAILNVTRSTTDRYLKRLEKLKKIKRVQGGAMPNQRDFSFCPSWYYQDNDPLYQERAGLGKKAAELIDDMESIFLGSGRNILHLAKQLLNRKICVVTNSLPTALLLAGTNNEVNVVGAVPISDEGILIGNSNCNIAVQKAFFAPGSLSEECFFNRNQLIVEFEKEFIGKAKEVVAIVDSDKFQMASPYKICSYAEVNSVITPNSTPENYKKIFKNNDVRAYYA
jgi:DeoR/GlpR family transcriptional regulator of sugar metabolism